MLVGIVERFKRRRWIVGALHAACLILIASPAQAIMLHQVDDFQDGTYQNWQGAAAGVLADVGPSGAGDHALLLATSGFEGGSLSRLTTYNGGANFPDPTQWTGNWTAAGIRRIAFDVLNPNSFELNLWLGIAGPGGPGFAGSNDAYVTLASATVPADEEWHAVEFRVLASDFVAWGAVDDPAAALADVFQFRILHSPTQDWRGAIGEANLLLDNIRTIPEPAGLALGLIALAAPLRFVRRRRLASAAT